MNIEKAAYWLVLAAFGFALLDVCPRGALQNLNHALGHTGSTLCRLATNAGNAVMASVFVVHPRLQTNSLSATDARELAQEKLERVQGQVEMAQDQAQQVREQALAKAEAVREEALANADALRVEARAKADAMREQALAQAAIARAEVELQRSGIQQLRLRVQPQVHLSHAASHHLLVMSNDLMSSDPCDYSAIAKAVRASIQLSDNEQ
jgi:hypothetical protein